MPPVAAVGRVSRRAGTRSEPGRRRASAVRPSLPPHPEGCRGVAARELARASGGSRVCSRLVDDRARRSAALAAFGLGDEDEAAWLASGRPAGAFDDWLVDRVARRPSGPRSRSVYGAENVHDFARRAILEAIALGPGDELLEIGCGGGLLLRDAMTTGARATGLDHSEEMVSLARERAPAATVVLGSAELLPFAGGVFTALAMSVVFFFLDDPVAVLRECLRVLRPGSPVAVFTTAPELRGTPRGARTRRRPRPLLHRRGARRARAAGGPARGPNPQ